MPELRPGSDFMDKKMFDEGVALIMRGKGQSYEKGKATLVESLTILEGVLAKNNSPYFNGIEFGFADTGLVPFASWFKALEVAGKFSLQVDEKFLKISAWCKRCRTRESSGRSRQSG